MKANHPVRDVIVIVVLATVAWALLILVVGRFYDVSQPR